MSRHLERSMARNLYAKFAKKWRQQKRLTGVYGQPGYKRPSFSEWYSMHQQNLRNSKKEAPPAQVQEQLEADPWAEQPEAQPISVETPTERGVMTINIAGSEDE